MLFVFFWICFGRNFGVFYGYISRGGMNIYVMASFNLISAECIPHNYSLNMNKSLSPSCISFPTKVLCLYDSLLLRTEPDIRILFHIQLDRLFLKECQISSVFHLPNFLLYSIYFTRSWKHKIFSWHLVSFDQSSFERFESFGLNLIHVRRSLQLTLWWPYLWQLKNNLGSEMYFSNLSRQKTILTSLSTIFLLYVKMYVWGSISSPPTLSCRTLFSWG